MDLRDEAVVKFPALIPVKVVFDTALEGAKATAVGNPLGMSMVLMKN